MPQAPGPKGRPLLGSLAEFRPDPLKFFHQITEEYGDIVGLRLGSTRSVLVTHPDAIQRVLAKNNKAYSKRTRGILRLKEVLGEGLLTQTQDDLWLRRRRRSQPTFRPRQLDGFIAAIQTLADAETAQWQDRVDITPTMIDLTMRVAGRCFFGVDIEASSELGDDFLEVMVINRNRFARPLNMPLFLPTPENLRFRAAMKRLHRRIDGWIADCRAQSEPGDDLLSRLVHAQDEEPIDSAFAKVVLRDEALTLLGAGHETTSNAVSFTLDCLARNPEAYRRLREEVQSAWGADEQPSFAQIRELRWTHACLEEGMRLYPPAWLFGRLCEAGDVLGGYDIAPGTLVMMSAAVTHRHPAFWEEPNAFRPQRFFEPDPDRHPFAYYPFSRGPRNCIGDHFAMLEMALILASIARRFARFEREDSEPLKAIPSLTLRPGDNIPVRLG